MSFINIKLKSLVSLVSLWLRAIVIYSKNGSQIPNSMLKYSELISFNLSRDLFSLICTRLVPFVYMLQFFSVWWDCWMSLIENSITGEKHLSKSLMNNNETPSQVKSLFIILMFSITLCFFFLSLFFFSFYSDLFDIDNWGAF